MSSAKRPFGGSCNLFPVDSAVKVSRSPDRVYHLVQIEVDAQQTTAIFSIPAVYGCARSVSRQSPDRRAMAVVALSLRSLI